MQPPVYPVPSPSDFAPNIVQSFLENRIAHESLPNFELDVFSGDPLKCLSGKKCLSPLVVSLQFH